MNAILEQINSMGKGFVGFAGPMLIQSSALILILLLVNLVLRRKVRAVFRYWIWMLVLVKLVLPSSLSSPVSLGFLLPVEFPNLQVTETRTAGDAQPVLPAKMETKVSEPINMPAMQVSAKNIEVTQVRALTVSSTVTWQGVVFVVWLAVVVVMGLLLLQRAIFVVGLVAQAKEASPLMNDMLKFCCGQMGVKGTIGLKVSANATSPAVCGLFRPVILIPQDLGSSVGARGLRAVLTHELAHIKRGDLWVNLVQTLLQIVYFYNPLLWLANAMIRRVREQAVDEAVLVAMGEKAQQYPEILLNVAKLAFEQPMLSLRLIGVVESKNALSARIKHILNRPMPKSAKISIWGLAAILIFGAVLLPMAKAEKGSNAMHLIDFEITKTDFLQGDSIEITELSGTSDRLKTGEKFTVKGKYSLASHDEAVLHVYATNGEISSHQGPAIRRGSGEFSRTFTFLKAGDLHLSFYPIPYGNSFGGVYFARKTAASNRHAGPKFAAALPSGVTVQEGVGFDGFIVGDANCTGKFIKSRLGEPDKEAKDEKDWWLVYHEKYGLDFWVSPKDNVLGEIRFNQGFKGKLATGISLTSTKEDVFKVYGKPVSEEFVDDLNLEGHCEDFGDKVLYKRSTNASEPEHSKIYYRQKRLLFWFEKDKINQFVIYANRRFTATLPNGVTVELLGVCEHPSKDKQWWRPDGEEISKPEFKAYCYQRVEAGSDVVTGPRSKMENAVLFKLTNHQNVTIPEIEFSKGGMGYKSKIAEDGTLIVYLDSLPNQKFPDKIDIRLAMGMGDFKQASEVEYSNWMNMLILLDDGPPIVVHPFRLDDAHRWLVADMSYNMSDTEFKLRCTSRGKMKDCMEVASIGGALPGHIRVNTFRLPEEVKIEDVNGLILQYRPYRWVEFKNVSLKPGVKTDVQTRAGEQLSSGTGEDSGRTRLLSKKERESNVDNRVSIVASVVKNNGLYLVPNNGLSLRELIKAAGYNKDKIAESYIVVLRKGKHGGMTALSFYSRNLETLFSGEESDIAIKPQDAVLGGYIEPSPNAGEFWGQYSFGDVIELTVNDDNAEKDMFADLDGGRLISPPDTLDNRDGNAEMRWIKENGIDVLGETSGSVRGLVGFNMYAVRVDNYFWNADKLKITDRAIGLVNEPVLLSVEDSLPVTYVMTTSTHAIGVLQILGFTENPKGVKIRYKLLQKKDVTKPDVRVGPAVQGGDSQKAAVQAKESGRRLADDKQGPAGVCDITPAGFDIRLDKKRGVCDLAVLIRNENKITIPKFKLRFYRGDPNNNLDELGNVQGGWHEAGPIEPGKTWNESTREFYLPDGQYKFYVILDYDNGVPDVNENNNLAVLNVKVSNGLPVVVNEAVKEQDVETATEKITEKLQILEDQRMRVTRDLDAAERALDEVRARYGITDLEGRSDLHPITKRFEQLQTEIDGVRVELGQIEAKIANLEKQAANAKEEQKAQVEKELQTARDDSFMLQAKLNTLREMREEAAARKQDFDRAQIEYQKRASVRDERKEMLNDIKSQIEKYRIMREEAVRGLIPKENLNLPVEVEKTKAAKTTEATENESHKKTPAEQASPTSLLRTGGVRKSWLGRELCVKQASREVPFAKGSKLRVENVNGEIMVKGAAVQQCIVESVIKVDTRSAKDANEILEKTVIRVEPEDGGVYVKAEHGGWFSSQKTTVDFEITIPEEAQVELHSNNGEIEIRRVNGSIEASTNNGEVSAANTAGKTTLTTNNGSIEITEANLAPGKITTNNGKIKCRNISGDLCGVSNNGEIDVGYADAAMGICNVDITTNNGEVKFKGPKHFSATVDVRTDDGSIDTNLPLVIIEGKVGKKAHGTIGKGEGRLRIVADQGSIEIR